MQEKNMHARRKLIIDVHAQKNNCTFKLCISSLDWHAYASDNENTPYILPAKSRGKKIYLSIYTMIQLVICMQDNICQLAC
jgi:hypothetical protein